MKKASFDNKEPAPAPPPRTKGVEQPDPESLQHEHKLHLPKVQKGWMCKRICFLATYTVWAIIGVLMSLTTIIVSSIASVATKLYDAEQSGRLMAMIVIALTGAITLSMVIYATVGAYRKKTKPLHSSAVALVIIAVIQSLIIAVAIHVTSTDELSIIKSLAESFVQAKQKSPRHVKLWASTQNDLQCCGLNGAEDYRVPSMPYYFPPNVPISCCPSYDPDRPAHTQERQREACKTNGSYYAIGCQGTVIEVFKGTSAIIVGVVVVLVVTELVIAALGVFLMKRYKRDEKARSVELQVQAPL